jgi:hypothetical protein
MEVTFDRKTKSEPDMKPAATLFLAVALAAGMAIAQDATTSTPSSQTSAKQDMKDAGHATKDAAKDVGHGTKTAAKDVGHATKKTTKKAVHKTASKTEEGAAKVENKTAPQ